METKKKIIISTAVAGTLTLIGYKLKNKIMPKKEKTSNYTYTSELIEVVSYRSKVLFRLNREVHEMSLLIEYIRENPCEETRKALDELEKINDIPVLDLMAKSMAGVALSNEDKEEIEAFFKDAEDKINNASKILDNYKNNN